MNKPLKKVYVEITNVCNLSCSFCHGTKRAKRFMSPDEFTVIAQNIKPYTDYVYLHLMGEPLIHPHLFEILYICREFGFHTAVTTNGFALKEKKELLEDIYKLSISLHSYEANPAFIPLERYVNTACETAKECAANGTICALRLWNGNGKQSRNEEIETIIKRHFPGEYRQNPRGLTLQKNVFLEYADVFDWPDEDAGDRGTRFCMALRDQAGILCDGTVVPCCLDAEGSLALGNALTQDFGEILSCERAAKIKDGFSQGKAVESLCKKCGFAAARFGTE